MGIVTIIQLNSQNFRQDKFKDESAQRTSVQTSPAKLLVSSFVNDAVLDGFM